MANKKKIIIALIFIVVMVAIIVVNLIKSSGKTYPVQTAKVERGQVVHVVSGTGKIQPEVAVRISAHVSAKITKLPVKEGDVVKKGQLLVELDRTRYEAAVVQARANLSSSEAAARQQEANMKKAKSVLERTKKLFDQGLISKEALEEAQTTYEVSKAQYEAAEDRVVQAKATLDQAKDDLDKTTIRSPIDGVVTQLNKEEGEIALGSQFQEDVIMVVSDLSNMEAVVEVDENDVVDVAVGDSARIEIDAFPDTVFIGRVSEISHSAKTKGLGTQEEVVNFEVKVTVLDKIGSVRPGMSANVDIISDIRKNVLKVPIQAVTVRSKREIARALNPNHSHKGGENDSSKSADSESISDGDLEEVVFVVRDHTAKIRPVKTGVIGEKEIEILNGLEEGDEIVIGSYRVLSKELKHNAKVKIEKAKSFQASKEGDGD